MGIVSSLLSQSKNKMKFLLVIAIAACGARAEAEADADPAFAYTVGSPLVYTGLPVVSAAAPAKTDDAAEAPATPLVLSYAGIPYTGLPYTGLTYSVAAPLAGCQNNEGALVPCNGGAYHYPYFLPGVVAAAPAEEAKTDEVVVTKREAEPAAEADPEADPWYFYSGYGGHHLGYAYTYAAPYTYAAYHHPH